MGQALGACRTGKKAIVEIHQRLAGANEGEERIIMAKRIIGCWELKRKIGSGGNGEAGYNVRKNER